MSANLAAEWEAFGIPKPSALMGVQPGAGMAFKPGIPFADLSKIPSSLLMLMVSGEHDAIVGSNNAIRIYKGASSLPKKNRNFVLMKTDRHGMPWVHSGHFSPVTMGRRRITTIDWFGYWKLFDGLCDAAFTGKNRKYALGNTREQRHMGTWSDGVPVIWFDNPEEGVARGQAAVLYDAEGSTRILGGGFILKPIPADERVVAA